MTNKVAILLSSYNGSRFISKQIKSIINQNYANWELFIRDDCSLDNTISIIQSFSKKDSRIHFIEGKSNLGPLKSFQKLLKFAKNYEYVMFSDQDDIWFPDKVSKSVYQIRKERKINQYALVYTNYYVRKNNSQTLAYRKNMLPMNIPNNILIQSWLMGCTMILSRDLVEIAYKIPISAVNHDNWFAKVASIIGKIGYIDEPTMIHILHDNNVTQTITNGNIKNKIKNVITKFIKRNDEFQVLYDSSKQLSTLALSLNISPSRKKLVSEYYYLFRVGFFKKKTIIRQNNFRAYTRRQNLLFKMILFLGRHVDH